MKKILTVFLLVPALVLAAVATVGWDAPTLNTDGTAITAPLTYNVYSGAKGAEVLDQAAVIGLAANVAATPGVEKCIEVTAVANGVESDRSAEVCTTKPFPKPLPPTNVKWTG